MLVMADFYNKQRGNYFYEQPPWKPKGPIVRMTPTELMTQMTQGRKPLHTKRSFDIVEILFKHGWYLFLFCFFNSGWAFQFGYNCFYPGCHGWSVVYVWQRIIITHSILIMEYKGICRPFKCILNIVKTTSHTWTAGYLHPLPWSYTHTHTEAHTHTHTHTVQFGVNNSAQNNNNTWTWGS